MFMDFVRRNAFWIFVSLSSLFVWIVRWIPESFVLFYNVVFISWDYYPRVLVRCSMYTVVTRNSFSFTGSNIGNVGC